MIDSFPMTAGGADSTPQISQLELGVSTRMRASGCFKALTYSRSSGSNQCGLPIAREAALDSKRRSKVK